MLIDEEFSRIKVFTYPDETDGYILFVLSCHGNQMLIFLRDVVIQNNDVVLPFRGRIRDHGTDHDVEIW